MIKPDGKTFDFLDEKHIDPSFLEVFEFDSSNQYIQTETKEFCAVCPFSGLPDIAYINIEYYPEGGLCIELKSLKYYFNSFRNVGIYQEAATKRIYDDLKHINGDIWEDKTKFTKTEYLNGLHPNAKGYKIVANILKKFVDDNII